jgi:hypothetical protein
MKAIELNKEVLIPSNIDVSNQENEIQHLKGENKLLIGSAMLSIAFIIVMIYSQYKNNTDEREKYKYIY